MTAGPSIDNAVYQSNGTSKNLSVPNNTIMLEAGTVEGGAINPGVREDDRPDHVVEENNPDQGHAGSPVLHRKCKHTKKGVCSIQV